MHTGPSTLALLVLFATLAACTVPPAELAALKDLYDTCCAPRKSKPRCQVKP